MCEVSRLVAFYISRKRAATRSLYLLQEVAIRRLDLLLMENVCPENSNAISGGVCTASLMTNERVDLAVVVSRRRGDRHSRFISGEEEEKVRRASKTFKSEQGSHGAAPPSGRRPTRSFRSSST